MAPVPACWLFKTSATSWPFNLESGVRVTCDSANFCLPRPLCSQLRPDVHDRRQTASSLNASLGGGIISPIRPGFFKMIVFRKPGDQCSIIVLLIIDGHYPLSVLWALINNIVKSYSSNVFYFTLMCFSRLNLCLFNKYFSYNSSVCIEYMPNHWYICAWRLIYWCNGHLVGLVIWCYGFSFWR